MSKFARLTMASALCRDLPVLPQRLGGWGGGAPGLRRGAVVGGRRRGGRLGLSQVT